MSTTSIPQYGFYFECLDNEDIIDTLLTLHDLEYLYASQEFSDDGGDDWIVFTSGVVHFSHPRHCYDVWEETNFSVHFEEFSKNIFASMNFVGEKNVVEWGSMDLECNYDYKGRESECLLQREVRDIVTSHRTVRNFADRGRLKDFMSEFKPSK